MDAGAALGGMVCALVLVLGIGGLIGAAILRAACSLYNKLAGSSAPTGRSRPYYEEERGDLGRGYGTGIQEGPSPARPADDFGYQPDPDYDLRQSTGVPEPTFGKAFAIILVTYVTNAAVGFVVGLMLGAANLAAGAGPAFGRPGAVAMGGMNLVVNLVMLPVGLLIMAGMITAMLPTTFGKAVLVALLYMAIAIAIALVIGVIVAAFIIAFGMARF